MGRSVGHGLGWLEFFEEMPEPRQKAKVLYPLPELLLCCLVGVLCGAEGWVEVEEYGEAKLAFLRRFLPFAHGIPSHDTFSDVFNALDPEGFKAAFIAWTAGLQQNIREIVAVDGKTLRRSFDRGTGQGPIHMISAWAAGQRLVLGQLAVDAKENEITAIPELLALLTLKGAASTSPPSPRMWVSSLALHASIGASRTAFIGSSTLSTAKTSAASESAMDPPTLLPSAT